jgi:hypothetical protein
MAKPRGHLRCFSLPGLPRRCSGFAFQEGAQNTHEVGAIQLRVMSFFFLSLNMVTNKAFPLQQLAIRDGRFTQQQQNLKRQRASRDQLVTLKREFRKNAMPTGAVRERIAQEINMTRRSVLIWFQNRYA